MPEPALCLFSVQSRRDAFSEALSRSQEGVTPWLFRQSRDVQQGEGCSLMISVSLDSLDAVKSGK